LEQRETGSNKGVGKIISRGKNDESTRVDKTQWEESKMTTQEEEWGPYGRAPVGLVYNFLIY